MNNFYSYLITDPKYYTNSPIKLKIILKKAILKKRPKIVCFRDKKSKNFKELAISFLKISRQLKVPIVLINSNIELAYKLKFDGVHLATSMIDKIPLAKRKKLFVIVSTHNFYEIKLAKKFGADMVTYSPIFYTPNKGEPKGVNNLRKTIFKANFPVIALGGIVKRDQIHKVKIKKAVGFASIRHFKNS